MSASLPFLPACNAFTPSLPGNSDGLPCPSCPHMGHASSPRPRLAEQLAQHRVHLHVFFPSSLYAPPPEGPCLSTFGCSDPSSAERTVGSGQGFELSPRVRDEELRPRGGGTCVSVHGFVTTRVCRHRPASPAGLSKRKVIPAMPSGVIFSLVFGPASRCVGIRVGHWAMAGWWLPFRVRVLLSEPGRQLLEAHWLLLGHMAIRGQNHWSWRNAML